MDETLALLRQLPLFSELGDAALARLAGRSVARSHGPGHVLFVAGEPCRGLYIVQTGRVRIFRTSPAGREQVLHTESAGHTVAELPLFDGGPYPASAITTEPSRLVFVPAAAFEALYREMPDVAQVVIRALGKRLRHLVQVADTLAFRDVAARLALFLADLADAHGAPTPDGTEVVLERTREELSLELGTARESVSRAFKQLQQHGLITLRGRRRVLIPNVTELRTLARPGERPQYR